MYVYAAYQVFQAKGHDTMAEIERAAELRQRTKGPMFDLSNIKIRLDGTMPGNPSTACIKQPYTDPWSQEHRHHGQPRLDMETLTAVFKRSHELGFTVHVRAIGDGALAMTLDAIEKVLAETGPRDYRDAITHLQVVDKADIPRMAKRGVVATSASDYPVINPAYPLICMQKGVIRQLPGRPDTLHNAGKRVTVEQMIEATTINEAYQLLCEDRLGSIAVGKEAIFSKIMLIPSKRHQESLKVLQTEYRKCWAIFRMDKNIYNEKKDPIN